MSAIYLAMHFIEIIEGKKYISWWYSYWYKRKSNKKYNI